ncbi:predicted protein [Botrytis cinerea T4]|uniref:Uncharacterized protein n=1 Tax=Botryotinia fuckeliana (strain T4) TaxID=999810 RepID=G2XRG0_BOTF4|nr:predicted protein [Botrytis cinerea T4]
MNECSSLHLISKASETYRGAAGIFINGPMAQASGRLQG